jgi:hypothetical protein
MLVPLLCIPLLHFSEDGVNVNDGKFGDLLAEVKSVHGKKLEGV